MGIISKAADNTADAWGEAHTIAELTRENTRLRERADVLDQELTARRAAIVEIRALGHAEVNAILDRVLGGPHCA